MSPREPKTMAALDAAADRVRATASTVITDAPTLLLELMRASTTYHQRSQLAQAQSHILVIRDRLIVAFGEALREKVDEELAGTITAAAPTEAPVKTDWSAISLVEENQVQEEISYGRIGQFISHECDAELRELDGYMSTLLRHAHADPERNPLRGSVVGWAMHRAIEKNTSDVAVERTLGKELGQLLAKAMKTCYAEIVADLRARGARPAELVARQVAGQAPRPGVGQVLSEDAVKNWERSLYGRLVVDAGDEARSWEASIASRQPGQTYQPQEGDPQTSAVLLERLMRGDAPLLMKAASPFSQHAALEHSDLNLTNLVRRLNRTMDSVRGTLEANASALESGHGALAPNLIRTHREALEQASQGKLDHMVIEVVSSLFDQIFSDTHVPPQMAREIARLQLPVLRVALRDPDFFASRRHPVRRFINRVSSLGAAMDEFDSGPGKELLERVSVLIQQIVDGDFEQVDLYAEKLLDLEKFAADQARAEIKESTAGETLQLKELEWKQLNRFSELMRTALEPLPLEAYLKQFLSQAWAQVIVTASQRDGADSDSERRYRVAGYELTVSLQPKRSLDDRKRFVSSLPGLMGSLNAGMNLIEMPQAERDAFFDQLISGHAASLKSIPGSELDHNLLLKKLQQVFRIPLPGPDDATATPTAQLRPVVFEQRFSAEEAQSVGLLAETAVDWSTPVEPDPVVEAVAEGAPAAPIDAAIPPPEPDEERDPNALPTLDLTMGEQPAPAPAPVRVEEAEPVDPGAQLRANLQVGFSYCLQLQDQWEKVRLTYMNPARSFFMFTHGSKDRRSISMTARMLERLCESRRMKAYEQAFLIDRATERARKQLAALAH